MNKMIESNVQKYIHNLKIALNEDELKLVQIGGNFPAKLFYLLFHTR